MLADNLKMRAHFEAFTARENEKNSLIDVSLHGADRLRRAFLLQSVSS